MKIAIVTATTDPERARDCILSWGLREGDTFIGIVNGREWIPGGSLSVGELTRHWLISPEYLGTVPAFRLGVDFALKETDAEIIACLHDDLRIDDENWASKVQRYFIINPRLGLCGFGGALAIGHPQIYKIPYEPAQLARHNFRSNLVDAETHGIRSLLAERVACLDGFSQIGRRAFYLGQGLKPNLENAHDPDTYGGLRQWPAPWTFLEEQLGLVHHIYDGALGMLAERYGWETWYVPVHCRHFGGRTAVGDSGYGDWAKQQHPQGDHGFWSDGHYKVYEEFRDVLPFRV